MNESVNVVIIGNPDSIWIKKYIEKVLNPMGRCNVYVVDLGAHKEGLFSGFYNDNNINIIRLERDSKHRLPVFGSWIYIRDAVRFIERTVKADIIHEHFVNWQGLLFLAKLKKRDNLTLISYWGSDILRESVTKLRLSQLWIGKADKITLTTAEMRRTFRRIYGTKFNEKIYETFFGVNCFDNLKRMDYSSQLYKSGYGIDDALITVTIGYNGSDAQQHLQVLDSIARLSPSEQGELFIIIPMTYGVTSKAYKEQVNKRIDKLQIGGYKILEDYMNEEESSRLKCVTDIFIHAQLTDAFSASVQEFLYAEKIVLNPEWIKYDEHEKMGIFYLKYENFETLDKLIKESIRYSKTGELKQKLEHNKEILQNTTSWEAVAPKWRSLYEMEK